VRWWCKLWKVWLCNRVNPWHLEYWLRCHAHSNLKWCKWAKAHPCACSHTHTHTYMYTHVHTCARMHARYLLSRWYRIWCSQSCC